MTSIADAALSVVSSETIDELEDVSQGRMVRVMSGGTDLDLYVLRVAARSDAQR
jgi:hypothetical protein